MALGAGLEAAELELADFEEFGVVSGEYVEDVLVVLLGREARSEVRASDFGPGAKHGVEQGRVLDAGVHAEAFQDMVDRLAQGDDRATALRRIGVGGEAGGVVHRRHGHGSHPLGKPLLFRRIPLLAVDVPIARHRHPSSTRAGAR